ncbi:MAG: rhomboid family intramembrane serine protease [Chloroflexota bacterium]
MFFMFIVFFLVVYALVWFAISSLVAPIPLNDGEKMRYASFPKATTFIIVVNVLVFVGWQFPMMVTYVLADEGSVEEAQAVQALDHMVYTFGSTAVAVREGTGIGAFSTVTGMFMHGSFSHLLANMFFLWAFGRRLEDACGSWRFLLLYLFTGFCGKTATYLLLSDIYTPSIGASGATSGLMGAYLIIFPRRRLQCIWLGGALLRGFWGVLTGGRRDVRRLVAVPALVLFFLYMASDLVSALQTFETGRLESNINYVAHAGGFLSGAIVLFMVRKDLLMRYLTMRKL